MADAFHTSLLDSYVIFILACLLQQIIISKFILCLILCVIFKDIANDCEELRVRGFGKSGDYSITLNHDAKFMVGRFTANVNTKAYI